jgi:hypothetical protein
VALERLWHLLKTHVPTYKGTAATTGGIWGVPQPPASKKFQADVWTMSGGCVVLEVEQVKR